MPPLMGAGAFVMVELTGVPYTAIMAAAVLPASPSQQASARLVAAVAELVEQRGFRGIGGSDAHFTSAVATCMTYFPGQIRTELELVQALRAGDFRTVRLEDTKNHR